MIIFHFTLQKFFRIFDHISFYFAETISHIWQSYENMVLWPNLNTSGVQKFAKTNFRKKKRSRKFNFAKNQNRWFAKVYIRKKKSKILIRESLFLLKKFNANISQIFVL